MKYTLPLFPKFLFFFVILYSSVTGQTPTDDTIPSPPGYTVSQLRAYAFACDNNYNKWVGFNVSVIQTTGLGKLNAAKVWTMYDSTNSPLPNAVIRSLACNVSGVWVGTNAGLYNFDGTNWKWYKTSNSNIPNDTVLNLYSDGGNGLWIYSNKGFTYFNGSVFTQYTRGNSGLVSDSVQCIFKSAAGLWWIGTASGLSSFDGVNWQSYTLANALYCDDNVTAINEDKNGYLFIGTNYGQIYMESGGIFTPLNQYLRSNHNYYIPSVIRNLFRLSDGRILFVNKQIEYFFDSSPFKIDVKQAGLYSSMDDGYLYAMEYGDRLWRTRKNVLSKLIVSDSLTYYQNVVPVTDPENYKMNFLDVNEVNCPISDNNTFFWDGVNSPGLYEVPKDYCGGKSALYASAIWIGGIDNGGNLHVAAQTYHQSGSDFWPGPLDTIAASIDSVTLTRYDSTWKVNRYTIDQFITQYQLGNVTSGAYKVPNVILNWPAHGTGNYSRNLAPFVDKNGDGIYNPYDGDYPEIKGDQMLWWVMNDNYNAHTESKCSGALGIEVQSKAYAHSCPNITANDEAVNFTTFYSDSIINRSDTDYHDVYIGIWVDADLGYYLDDYVGCRINGDYGFAYNGDNYDEGAAGYGANPPMISVAILKGPQAEPGDGLDNNHNGVIDEPGENCMMNHFLYYNNSSSNIDGNPTNCTDYYYYLTGRLRNGSQPTACGIPTDYMFSGMPYDTGCTEMSAGNQPDDRRFIMTSGPFSLKAHQSKTIDYAIVFSWDKTQPNGVNTSVAKNDADVMKVKHWFETDSFPCVNSSIGIPKIENNNGLFIYPNPAQGKYSLVFKGKAKAEMELMDITGRVVKQQTVFANQKNNIDVYGIERGMYVVKVKDSQGISSRRIIIE